MSTEKGSADPIRRSMERRTAEPSHSPCSACGGWCAGFGSASSACVDMVETEMIEECAAMPELAWMGAWECVTAAPAAAVDPPCSAPSVWRPGRQTMR
jgi:hypothetical protein